jgi:hypothetical protein
MVFVDDIDLIHDATSSCGVCRTSLSGDHSAADRASTGDCNLPMLRSCRHADIGSTGVLPVRRNWKK